jgi:RNA-directed DNA polymerase
MKTYTNIFNDAISIENVFLAWDEFKGGKRKKKDVQQFERFLEDNLFELYEELLHRTYKHSGYTAFYVKDPKIRRIHKATVRERIIHHLVYNILNPIFEPTFISDSYSCRTDKGTHRGVRQLARYANKVQQTHGQCFALKCDIQKFFDTVDHHVLLTILQQRIKDPDLFWLITEVIESYVTPVSRERERERE